MFAAVVVLRRIGLAIVRLECGRHIQQSRGSRPRVGPRRVERLSIDEGLEGGAGLARGDGHVQRAVDKFVEIACAADECQDLAGVRVEHDHGSVVDIVPDLAGPRLEAGDAVRHNLFSLELIIQIERGADDQALSLRKLAGGE